MRSMTGFGVGEAVMPPGRIVVEARSVNHRFLDVRVRVPREIADQALLVEQVARAKLSRGRVEVSVHCEGCAAAPVTLDRARAVALMREFQAVADELGVPGPVALSVLAGVPDLFVHAPGRDPEALRAALSAGVERALADLDRMRGVEGDHLAADLGRRLDAVKRLVGDVARRAEGMVGRHRARCRERLERLLEGSRLDPTRFEQEVAILADHVDVAEELTRLGCHCAQFEKLLAGAEPSGRRMDFLLQEMGREVNTIASKASEAEVALAIVELKAEIERMREQAQNVE